MGNEMRASQFSRLGQMLGIRRVFSWVGVATQDGANPNAADVLGSSQFLADVKGERQGRLADLARCVRMLDLSANTAGDHYAHASGVHQGVEAIHEGVPSAPALIQDVGVQADESDLAGIHGDRISGCRAQHRSFTFAR